MILWKHCFIIHSHSDRACFGLFLALTEEQRLGKSVAVMLIDTHEPAVRNPAICRLKKRRHTVNHRASE